MPAAEAPLRRADLPWLAVIVLTGGVIGPLALMQGLKLTSAANASLLLNLEGLATMAIAWVVFRENVDARLLSGAAAILCGAALLSWQGWRLSLNSGALLVAGACLAWGIDNNLTRKLSSADPVSIATIKGLVAGGVNVAAALFLRGAVLPAPDSLLLAALLGFFGIGVSLVLFILALRHLGDRAHRGLFLAGAVHRRARRDFPAARAADAQAGGRGRADGIWRVAASVRAARA